MMTATMVQQASEHYNSSNRSNGYQSESGRYHPVDNPCSIDMTFEQMLSAMTGHKVRREAASAREKQNREKHKTASDAKARKK